MSATAQAADVPVEDEARMSLMEHLGELRTRLFRATLSVLVLGAASLYFAKEIFGFLMRPVLAALPADMPSLIYTSAIEEINVLLKVGMYAGIFLATPVTLYQLWSFVAPGLYQQERRYAAPFVVLGTLSFLVGAAFCYMMVLPTMFQFLLQEGNAAALEQRIESGKLQEEEALRYLRLGDAATAATLAKNAGMALKELGDGQAAGAEANLAQGKAELSAGMVGLGRLIDATLAGYGQGARPRVRQVMETRLAALTALEQGNLKEARTKLEEAAALLASVSASNASDFQVLWRLEKSLAVEQARYDAENWTRPMLTMKEQLSLVLILELAFGVIFELPLVMALLGLLGLLKASFLIKYQRHAIVVCLIGAAILTPTGDAVNLALMAVPMMLCYELGVLAVWLIEKRRKRGAAGSAIEPT